MENYDNKDIYILINKFIKTLILPLLKGDLIKKQYNDGECILYINAKSLISQRFSKITTKFCIYERIEEYANGFKDDLVTYNRKNFTWEVYAKEDEFETNEKFKYTQSKATYNDLKKMKNILFDIANCKTIMYKSINTKMLRNAIVDINKIYKK